MRRPIPKYLALWLVASFLCIDYALGQCDVEVQYSVEKKSENAYSIYLKSGSPASSDVIKIQLYDLFTGKTLQEKEIHSLNTTSQEVFRDIPPSKYAIIIRVDGCDKPKTLGGINGISIGIPD